MTFTAIGCCGYCGGVPLTAGFAHYTNCPGNPFKGEAYHSTAALVPHGRPEREHMNDMTDFERRRLAMVDTMAGKMAEQVIEIERLRVQLREACTLLTPFATAVRHFRDDAPDTFGNLFGFKIDGVTLGDLRRAADYLARTTDGTS